MLSLVTRAFTILLFTGAAGCAESRYTANMYRRALAEQSTAPLFALITLHDLKTGSDRLVCIPAPFLLGAIASEYHIDYDEAGSRKQFQIAVFQPERKFTFRNSNARRNAQPTYTPEILAHVRQLLADKSSGELRKEARATDTPLHKLYRSKTNWAHAAAYRDAIAHILLERGILAGVADRTGGLYVIK